MRLNPIAESFDWEIIDVQNDELILIKELTKVFPDGSLSWEILNLIGQKHKLQQLLSTNVEALDYIYTLLFRLEIEYKNAWSLL